MFKRTVLIASAVIIFFGSIFSNAQVVKPKMDLHAAIVLNNMKIVQQHIDAKTDLNIKEPTRASTPLITAALFDRPEAVKMLLNSGAEINYQNSEGSTALHTAAFFCRTDIVKILLENGADKSIKNNWGSTAYESVIVEFKDVKAIYESVEKGLKPLGIEFNYDEIEQTRPKIAEMLK